MRFIGEAAGIAAGIGLALGRRVGGEAGGRGHEPGGLADESDFVRTDGVCWRVFEVMHL